MAKSRKNLLKSFNYKQIHEYYHEPKGLRFSLRVKLIIFLFTTLLCTLFFSVHYSPYNDTTPDISTKEGNIWHGQTVVAEYSFPIYKNNSLFIKEKNSLKEKVQPVFTIDETAATQSSKLLSSLITNLLDISSNSGSKTNFLTAEELKKLVQLSDKERTKEINNIYKYVKAFITNTYKNGFINKATESVKTNEISVSVPPNTEFYISKDALTDSSKIIEDANKFLSNKLSRSSTELAEDIILKITLPNLIFSKTLTERNEALAEQSLAQTDGVVRKGDLIISKNERITDLNLRKLQSYEKSKRMKNENIYSFWFFIGSFGHTCIIYLILIMYLYFIRKRIFYDNFQILILSLLLIFVALLSWLSIEISTGYQIEFLIILPAFSMLAAIVFDSRTAFYSTVTMALMLSGIRGSDYDLGISMMFAGTLAAYTVRDIQSRTQIFKSIFYIFIGLVIPVVFIALEHSSELMTTVNKITGSLINATISPLITFGLLFILERFSNITTDLKVREFDNINNPLLVRMSEKAPGTYQHTTSLAALAERCARAVNANPLLTRVGVYYHDIGKTVNPDYFTENQIDNANKHDGLTALKSAEAIKNHIIDGIRLAKEHRLPKRIIDFIPMHHGTSIIKHFYAKAVEETNNISSLNEDDFRYPGPKPNTKETAIVMICDAAEALSRVPFKDKEDLEKAIEKAIQEKINDGQFDESDLSMKEIRIIKDTCIKSLQSLTHPRVEYKELPVEKKDSMPPTADY